MTCVVIFDPVMMTVNYQHRLLEPIKDSCIPKVNTWTDIEQHYKVCRRIGMERYYMDR